MPQPNQQDQQNLPDDELVYDPTQEQMQQLTQKGQQEYLQSLKGQEQAAEEGVRAVHQQGEAAIAGEREKSGRAFAAQMAQGGGGSLAGMRQSQLARGVAEGQLMGDYTMQEIAAKKLAAGAKSEYLTEKQKLQQQAYELPLAAQKEADDASAAIRNVFNERVKNEFWWGEDDRKSMAKWVADHYYNDYWKKRNPKVYAMAEQAYNEILTETGSYNP